MRKNGHWFLTGRINYRNDGVLAQKDFDLKIIPPANLIAYDTLALSWHNIKDRVPDALDALHRQTRMSLWSKQKIDDCVHDRRGAVGGGSSGGDRSAGGRDDRHGRVGDRVLR